MRRALEECWFPRIDVIITHATGTIKGDIARSQCYWGSFGAEMPLLYQQQMAARTYLRNSGALGSSNGY